MASTAILCIFIYIATYLSKRGHNFSRLTHTIFYKIIFQTEQQFFQVIPQALSVGVTVCLSQAHI